MRQFNYLELKIFTHFEDSSNICGIKSKPPMRQFNYLGLKIFPDFGDTLNIWY
jgi:hypothetical protein